MTNKPKNKGTKAVGNVWENEDGRRGAGHTIDGLTHPVRLNRTEGFMKPTFKPKVCAFCGVEFAPSSGRALFCSKSCRLARDRAAYVPKPRRPLKPLEDRLWARVEIGDPDECWEWQGFRNKSKWGYGQIGVGRREEGLMETHRAAWVVTRGPIPDGLVVRHRCDNPPCCNPAHLTLGTQAQNAQDALDRNRTAREFRLPHCRLSDDQVRAIRDAFNPAAYPRVGMRVGNQMRSNARELAEQYGVTENYITQIVRKQYREGVA